MRNVPRNVVGKQWSFLPPAPFFNLGSCGRNCIVLIYFYRKSKQSKLFGHFAVVLPTQCWCTRFGELTAINNIGRTRRRARSEKKKKNSVGWKCPHYFCLRLQIFPSCRTAQNADEKIPTVYVGRRPA